MSGPQDPPTAGGGQLRAGHADRDQVIETLKDAFVDGRLTKDELDARAGRALAARTRAELAALTADIPPAPGPARAGRTRPSAPARPPTPPAPARPPTPARRRPLVRAAAGSGGCLVIAAAAVRVAMIADPGDTPGPIPKFLAPLGLLIALTAVVAALCIVGYGVAVAIDQRRSRRQLPPAGGRVAPGQR